MAVEKATNNDLCTPKEKHVQTLLEVVRPGASIADVTFLVKYLNQQVTDATKWLCMLKTHILIHRLLADCGDEFKSQLKKIQQWAAEDRGKDPREKSLFAIRNWKDDSGVDANEFSGWRGYLRPPSLVSSIPVLSLAVFYTIPYRVVFYTIIPYTPST